MIRGQTGVGIGWLRPLDGDGVEHRHAERQRLLGATDARMPQADRPGIVHVAKVLRRATGVRLRTFATHLVQAVAETMRCVAELGDEAAGVEVSAALALIVNDAAVGE